MNANPELPVTHGAGRSWRVDTGDFAVSEIFFNPGFELPVHYHESACLSLLASGSMEKGFRSKRYELPSSSLITIPPGEEHTDLFGGDGTRIVVVEMGVGVTDRHPVMEPGTRVLDEIVEERSRRIDGFARRLSKELRSPDDLSGLAVSGLVFELISSLGRNEKPHVRASGGAPRWLRIAIEYLREHDDRLIQIEEVADEVGLHPGYLARAFREYVGMPLAAYAREIRLERVAAELAHSDERILDIAIAAGFTDQSHLTRLFRRRFGVTPGQYRATVR